MEVQGRFIADALRVNGDSHACGGRPDGLTVPYKPIGLSANHRIGFIESVQTLVKNYIHIAIIEGNKRIGEVGKISEQKKTYVKTKMGIPFRSG